jgi:hypothetical protein
VSRCGIGIAKVAGCCAREFGEGWRGFVFMARRADLKGFDMGYGISKLCVGGMRVCSCRLVLSR